MARKFRNLVLILFISLLPINQLFADGSIYSLKGQGSWFYFPGGRAAGMGGATISVANSLNLNWINPASLSVQDHVRIQTQFFYQNMTIDDGSQQFNTNYGNFSGFIGAFSIYSGIGIGFGIQPLSKINYEFETGESINQSEYSSIVRGNGGLSRLFLSTGIKLHPRIKVGGGFGLIFGKSDEIWRVNFENSEFVGSFDQYRSKYSGLNMNIGAIVTPFSGWNIGGLYQVGHTLNKKLDINYFGAGISENSSSKLELPSLWGIGTSILINKRFLFAADYLTQNWETYPFGEKVNPSKFIAMKRFSFGLEYGEPIGELDSWDKSFFARLRYRVGVFWQQPYFLDYDNNSMSSYFVSGGLGIPFLSGGGAIDLALEYGKRGKLPDNSFSESIWRLSIYFAGGELWFQR